MSLQLLFTPTGTAAHEQMLHMRCLSDAAHEQFLDNCWMQVAEVVEGVKAQLLLKEEKINMEKEEEMKKQEQKQNKKQEQERLKELKEQNEKQKLREKERQNKQKLIWLLETSYRRKTRSRNRSRSRSRSRSYRRSRRGRTRS